jgi:REP element-mobilizing transposase RayT
MFSSLRTTEPVANIVADEEHIHLVAEYLQQVSEVVNVNWFLSRAEPHITQKKILKNGCDFEYSYRPNLYDTFTELDSFVEVLINSYSNDRLNTVSQNEMFQFNFPSDFMNCNTIYWSDGDHFSASGEEYFGKRVTRELLLNE